MFKLNLFHTRIKIPVKEIPSDPDQALETYKNTSTKHTLDVFYHLGFVLLVLLHQHGVSAE